MAELYTAIIVPGKSLGIFTLGQSLHEITTRLKTEPKDYTKLDIAFSQDAVARNPIVLTLSAQGIRLRFDGPYQRLRLIEVIDFTKNTLSYKEQDILSKPSADTPKSKTGDGPSFKHIYSKVFGPTFPGEYLEKEDKQEYGTYTLSYPGIAFNFPVTSGTWNPNKDFASILSSPSTLPATSLAIFAGPNWPDARATLFFSAIEDPRLIFPSSKDKQAYPDEISTAHILGGGTLKLEKAYGAGDLYIQLGRTTPLELLAELGPPDAVYRKSDQQLSIHRARTHSGNSESTTGSGRSGDHAYDSHGERSPLRGGDINASGTSEEHTEEEEEEDEEEEASDGQEVGDHQDLDDSEDYFYNYFHHGFDVLISRPAAPSEAPPSASHLFDVLHQQQSTPSSSPSSGGEADGAENGVLDGFTPTSAPLVATKIIFHANIPGTYAFGRHRRVRWTIPFLRHEKGPRDIDSETPYPTIAGALNNEFRDQDFSGEERRQRERGMALNRGWGESFGGSVEVLGNWDEGSRTDGPVTGKRRGQGNGNVDMQGSSSTTSGGKNGMGSSVLYGWPGLVFEVGRGGVVSGLTVF